MAEAANEARRELCARGTPRFALAKATSNPVRQQDVVITTKHALDKNLVSQAFFSVFFKTETTCKNILGQFQTCQKSRDKIKEI